MAEAPADTPNLQELATVANAFTVLRSQPLNLLKQIEEAISATISRTARLGDLSLIVWRDRRFVLEQHLSHEKSRGRRSWIKDHGTFLAEMDGTALKHKGIVWSCKRCAAVNRPQLFIAQSTSSAMKHLEDEHSIREQNAER